jgi:regulator of sigma E protease
MESPPEFLRVLIVILGIGLVIFVHELGHYLAARICGVRVETLSLGFGPRLIARRIGDTVYQIALVPLGGFCKMAGEERRLDGQAPRPDELHAKGVGQRFFIYSGGVLMNVAFGLVVFPILFHVGVPFTRPIIGETIPGGAAWHERIPEGSEVLTVNGNRVFEFLHIPTEVALGDPERAVLVVRVPGTRAEKTFELRPRRDATEGIGTIGVVPDFERDEAGRVLVDVTPGSPAERAGVKTGDRLISVSDAIPGLNPLDQIAVQIRGEKPLVVWIESERGAREFRIRPEFGPELQPPRVGIAAPLNRVLAVRSSALSDALGIRSDDRLLEVEGRPIRSLGDFHQALLARSGELELLVQRDDRPLALSGPEVSDDEALRLASDVALVPDELSTVIVVHPGEPADRAGLRSGDRIVEIDGFDVKTWTDVTKLIKLAGREERAASFRIARRDPRGSAEQYEEVPVKPEARPVASYGLSLRPAQYVYRSDSVPEAIGFGAYCSWKFLQDSWLTLKRMVTRDVSPRNVGGIITISAVSYSLTESGWAKLFFFWCLVSINLAFLNVLPIPVLDGGHLFFLIVEKLKGSPVSSRVLGYSQLVGVVLILFLMVYVTYNDLVRWVFTD